MSLRSLCHALLLHNVTSEGMLTQYSFNRYLLGTCVIDHLILARLSCREKFESLM